jgi:hypothetical protein
MRRTPIYGNGRGCQRMPQTEAHPITTPVGTVRQTLPRVEGPYEVLVQSESESGLVSRVVDLGSVRP